MFQIDFASRVPIFEQLYFDVIKLASAGVINVGDKLPPVRTLATQLGINPNTVAKAYKNLENDGYIVSTVGKGSFLTDRLSKNNAEKLMALNNVKKAVKNAVNYSITKNELEKIIEHTISGGDTFD